MNSKPAKLNYTEAEAAAELGLSVDRLRALVSAHIAGTEEEQTNIPLATYERSDLLLLRILSAQNLNPTNPC